MDLEKLMILFDNPSEMDVMRFTLIYICSNLTPPPPPQTTRGCFAGALLKKHCMKLQLILVIFSWNKGIKRKICCHVCLLWKQIWLFFLNVLSHGIKQMFKVNLITFEFETFVFCFKLLRLPSAWLSSQSLCSKWSVYSNLTRPKLCWAEEQSFNRLSVLLEAENTDKITPLLVAWTLQSMSSFTNTQKAFVFLWMEWYMCKAEVLALSSSEHLQWEGAGVLQPVFCVCGRSWRLWSKA